jgi:hypothetical protein
MEDVKKRELRFSSDKYTIEVIDSATGEVLRTKIDHSGESTSGLVSKDGQLATYITCNHHWHFPPEIHLWNLETNQEDTISTQHHVQSMWLEIAYHRLTNKIVVGGVDGISAYDTRTMSAAWSRIREGPNQDKAIRWLAFSEMGDLVCALEPKAVILIEAVTGRTIARYPIADTFYYCEFFDSDQAICLKRSVEDDTAAKVIPVEDMVNPQSYRYF